MYSHKRSFTGQSGRSFTALFDTSFLLGAGIAAALFSIFHALINYYKLEHNIRSLPHSVMSIAPQIFQNALRNSVSMVDLRLTFATWIGLMLPLLCISVSVRWTLGSLRVSVQRTVTTCCLVIFYFCSFMTVALHNPEWTPGNVLVRMFQPLGEQFFESLRAILCLSLAAASIYTLGKNATSRFNRNLRFTTAGLIFVAILFADYFKSRQTRTIHDSYLKPPSKVKFLFIVPGLLPADVPIVFAEQKLAQLKEQITSFQEIHPSTPSLLGQFVTSMLGVEPNTHGIRHDFIDDEIVFNLRGSLRKKLLPGNTELHATAFGGPTPLTSLFDENVPGSRCGQSLSQIAKTGMLQTSVVPFSLTPRLLDDFLHPELICSTRYLSLDQHMFQTFHKIVSRLHEPGNKIFLIWLSNNIVVEDNAYENKNSREWTKSTKFIYSVLLNHLNFLNSANLIGTHQTFLLGLAESGASTTAFVRLDGQTKSTLTDLTLDSPGQRGQSAIATMLKGQSAEDEKESPYFYSEFNHGSEAKISEIPPSVQIKKNETNSGQLLVDHSTLRRAVFNANRHVICQNVASTSGKRLFVKVSLNLLATENRLPELRYEDIESAKLPPQSDTMELQDCLNSAREQLMESVVQDVSLRDSAAFKTLLTGLPVKSIKTPASNFETTPESEESLDESTSSLPTPKDEEEED